MRGAVSFACLAAALLLSVPIFAAANPPRMFRLAAQPAEIVVDVRGTRPYEFDKPVFKSAPPKYTPSSYKQADPNWDRA